MALHDDFSARVLVHSEDIPWQASPMLGVERRMLDRIGDEVARATSLVRYAPGSHFSPHVHAGGEEYFVLSGIFQDEHGDYPTGTYVRNPPTSGHTPAAVAGCVIFVKLWQFDPADRTHVIIDTGKMRFVSEAGRSGVAVMPLFCDANEDVRLERWAPGSNITIEADGGLELLVLDGSFAERGDRLGRHDWLRLSSGDRLQAAVGDQAVTAWIKTGHLRRIRLPYGDVA